MTTPMPSDHALVMPSITAGVLDCIADGVCVLDADWRIVYLNRRAAAELCCGHEAAVGQIVWEIVPRLVDSALTEPLHLAMREHTPCDLECADLCPGHWHQVRATPSASGLVITFSDITERKLVEAREERLRVLMNQNPSLIFVKDEAGRYVYLNAAYEREFVKSPDWEGKTDFDFWPAESARLYRDNDAAVMASGHLQQFLEDSSDADGKRHCWLCYKFPFTDSQGHRFLGGIGIDAVERVQAEEALRRQADLLDRVSDAIVSTDADFRITSWNMAAERIYGWTAAEALNRNADEIFGTRFLSMTRDDAAATLTSAGYVEISVMHLDRAGNDHHIQSNIVLLRDALGHITGTLGVLRDITIRMRAEEALRESESRFKMLADATFEAIAIHADGVLLDANEQFLRMFGYTREDAIGLAISRFVHPDDMPRVLAISAAESDDWGEYRNIRRDGSIFVAETQGRSIWYQGRKARITVIHDIDERKRAEEALRESEARFKMLAEATFEAIAIHADGVLLDANEQFLRLHGYTREEVIGQPISLFLHPEDVARALDISARLSEARGEYRDLRKDGSIFPVEVQGRTIQFDGRLARITAINDITERKRAETELRESEARYRQLVENTTAIIVQMDADGIIRYANERALQFFDYSARELIGQPAVGTVVPPRDSKGYDLVDMMGRLIRQPERFRLNANENMRKSGERVWVEWTNSGVYDAEGTLAGVLSVGIDATELMQAMTALRESESRFRAMADGTPLMIWVTDAEGKMQFINRAYGEFFGTTLEQVQAEGWQTLIHPEDEADFMTAFSDALRSRTSFQAEVRVRRADGEWRWIESFGEPRFGYAGEYLGMAGSSPDITARKLAEQTLHDANRAKDEFLALVSHELQTPLTSMLGWSSQALRLGDHKIMAQAMEVVYRNAVRQKHLIADLLDTSRLIHRRMELLPKQVDLVEQVRIAVENIAPQAAERELRLALEMSHEPLPVYADTSRLQQCLGNLLSNGLKFTPTGGVITVRCRRDGDQAVVAVEDTGRGIAAADLSTLFQYFHQVNRDERTGGLGLGLAITHGIITLHGGTLRAESDGPGQGSRFTMSLPLV